MNKNSWKRFAIYQKILAIFFIFNLLLTIVSKKLSTPIIPFNISTYLFWLSLGLYLGFQLCKHEYSNAMKKMK
jgi:hypothetical protein